MIKALNDGFYGIYADLEHSFVMRWVFWLGWIYAFPLMLALCLLSGWKMQKNA